MAELLIEIGTEELPPSAISAAEEYLKERFSQILKVPVKVYSTPRRIAIYAENFEDRKAGEEEIVYGPPWKSAFDEEGNPTKALLGFLKRYGLSPKDVEKAKKGKGEYVAVRISKGDESILDDLRENFEEILLSIPFPKKMRWTSSKKIQFSRPVRWILALHGNDTIDLAFGEVRSSNFTYGHRFLSKGKLYVTSPFQYFSSLEEADVIVDRKKRRELILRGLIKTAESIGAEPVLIKDLLEEVTDLVEYPFMVLGSFEDRFLQLPDRVIITVLAHHQRFFCLERDGKILSSFIGISNNRPSGDEIRKGYERVIRARLEDALFFYREDLKKPLVELVPSLSGVLIHPRIGTVLDKVKRMEKIAIQIVSRLGLGEIKDKVLRAVRLSKADLLTEMVREFDELQGYMGMVYALEGGEDEEVARAIYDQYLPDPSGEEMPQTLSGSVLSLADKIHDLIYFFSAGEVPTGASDPYGLRRSAFGVFRVLDKHHWNLDIKDLMQVLEVREGGATLEDFLAQRLESYLEEEGYDVVRAVLAVTSALKPYDVIEKVRKVAQLKKSEDFSAVYEVYRRAVKIIPKGWESEQVDENLLKERSEKALWEKVLEFEKSPPDDPSSLIDLKDPVDRLFDEVLIMDKDEKVKSNRLSLLFRVKKIFNRFADFSLLVPQEVK